MVLTASNLCNKLLLLSQFELQMYISITLTYKIKGPTEPKGHLGRIGNFDFSHI